MISFGKNKKQSEKPDYYPLVCISNSIKDSKKELARKEVASLDELRGIQDAFDRVLQMDDELKQKMSHFGDVFSSLLQ